MNIMKRVGLATAGLLTTGALLAPAALADVNCTISGNGAGSSNSCNIKVRRVGHNGCKQNMCDSSGSATNNATVKNKVKVKQNTGGNRANSNTGGNVTIETGNNTATVTITNNVNSNNP